MKTPFTAEAFLTVFEKYNSAIWPLQLLFYLLAFTAIIFTIKKNTWSDKIISLILSFFWLWMGIVYHLIFFTTINKAAYLFGIIFIIQGLLFLYYGVFRHLLSFQLKQDAYSVTGLILIIFSLLLYPIIGHVAGHPYPYSPTFGLPCPTTIFTFGLLLWTNNKPSFIILIIPFLWSLLGFSAALSLGIFEDVGLVISGLTATLLLWLKNKSNMTSSVA
jgi:hypothetical protein